MIVPQTAADPTPINMIAARKATESNNPSSSTYAREISEITIAGATLLKGTGVSSRTTVNNRTMMPTARFPRPGSKLEQSVVVQLPFVVNAAAQARTVSAARIRLDPWKSAGTFQSNNLRRHF